MKGNGVGKALACFSLSLFILIPIHADVVLHVLNDDNEEIQDVVVGQPFYLEVSINGLGRTTPPLLDGADHINARRTGYQMSSVNGDASIKYTYVATADKPGEHIVGPAHVYAKGKEYVSGVAKVAVHTDTRAIASNQRKTDPVFLRASVDKAHVVVGECVTCHLRFYYDRSMLALKSIGQHDIDGFEQKNIVGPEQGTEVVDGKRYEYAQWAWQWYPRQTGEFAVPAHYADFESRSSRSDNVRQWGAFFNARRRQKRVYSNALNIKVDPLPDYPNEVAAVGNFTHVRASISPGMAKQGEGMILAFEFDGEGDLDALQVPIVRGMPEELKYYDSKTNIELNDNGLSTKRFEFVVQALKPGTFEIPQQTFTIFDTESRFYKQLETAPLLVTISPSNALDQVAFQEPQSEDTVSADTALNDAWLPLHEHGPWIARSERKPMPPFLFIFFFDFLSKFFWQSKLYILLVISTGC